MAISGAWHLLVLAVLVLAVHPFQLPMQDAPPFELQLLPPMPDLFKTPRPRPEPVRLRPRTPRPPPLQRARPEDRVLDKPVEVAPTKVQPRTLQQRAQVQTDALDKPAEVNRQQAAKRKLDTAASRLDLPPAPLDETHLNQPALPRLPEVVRTAPARTPSLDLRRLPPELPAAQEAKAPAPSVTAPAPSAAAQAEAAPQAPGQVQVLTNQTVIQAPVEIRPPDRAPTRPVTGGVPAAPDVPLAGGGEPPGGGGAPPAGAGGGGPRTGPNGSVLRGFDTKGIQSGLRMRLGCESPETYHLTSQEREACLARLAAGARSGDLGLNISAQNQAAYDHFEACQDAYHRAPIPSSHGDSEATSVKGVGANPSLRACGPGAR